MHLLSNGIQKSDLTCGWEYTVEKFDIEELNTYWNLKLIAVPIVCLPPGTFLVSVNHIASRWPGRWCTFFASDWLQAQQFRQWRWCCSIVKKEDRVEFIRRLGLGQGGQGWSWLNEWGDSGMGATGIGAMRHLRAPRNHTISISSIRSGPHLLAPSPSARQQ
jgi:hypothetical protein